MNRKKVIITLIVSIAILGSGFTAFAAINNNSEPVTASEMPSEVVTASDTEENNEPYPDSEVVTWELGDNVTATLKAGELSITGKGRAWIDRPPRGEPKFIHSYVHIPWIGDERAQNSIKSVVIADTVEIHDMGGWFWCCENLTDISGLKVPNMCKSMENTFRGCSKLTDVSTLKIPNSVTNLKGLLSYSAVTNIPDDLIPDNAQDISYIFCETSIKDLESFQIPNTVQNAKCAFWKCKSLTNVDGIVVPNGAITFRMFGEVPLAAGTVTIKGTPSDYRLMFYKAGKDSSGIVVDYTDSASIDEIIATSENGNVTKGTLQ